MSIYLIRHAQSEFNAAYKDEMPDPMIFDAPLSELGREQAVATRANITELGIERIIVSPLTRTLQTAELIFQRSLPTQVNALVREQLSHSGDVGTHPEILSKEWTHLDFDHLDNPWWHDGKKGNLGFSVEPLDILKNRAQKFFEFLQQTQVKSTAVVTHGNFIRVLTGIQPDNCQILKLEV